MSAILHQIDIGYACFGIITTNGTVIESAPIGQWMVGHNFHYIEGWVRGKGGTIISMIGGNI